MKYRTRIYYTAEQKAEMWGRWQRGESINAIGRAFDRGHSSIAGQFERAGGIRPPLRRRSKLALTLSEREEISRGIAGGVLVQRMFVPADRVIALRIYYGYCILRRRILTELVFRGHDARQIERTPDPASEELARLREVSGAPRDRAGPLRHCIRACLGRR